MQKKVKKNTKITLRKDGILKYTEQAKLDKKISEKNYEKVLNLMKKMKPPRKMLVDLSVVVMPPVESRKIIVKMISSGWTKIAVFGTDSIAIKTISKFIMLTAGVNNFKFFATEQEALKWLKSNDKKTNPIR